jgi:hypothetical protein
MIIGLVPARRLGKRRKQLDVGRSKDEEIVGDDNRRGQS